MRRVTEQEKALLEAAHRVLAEYRQVMLPHHQNVIGPRLETFDEMQIHEVNVTGIRGGRFRTNIVLLTHTGQRPTLSHAMTMQDTVIIDLSKQVADVEAMRQFLLTSEAERWWHHAPWLVINLLKKGRLR